MHLEPQVTFKNVAPSDAVLGQIQAHLDKLDRKFGGIRSCRLVFERPKHHLRPEDRFRIDLVLVLAGGLEIAINRDAPPVPLEEPGAAVQDAFEMAEQRMVEAMARPAKRAPLRGPVVFEWEQP